MGTIRKREGPRGVSFQVDWIDPDKTRKRKAFKTLKDAKLFLSSITVDIAAGTYQDIQHFKKQTLGGLAEPYIKEFQKQRSFDISKVYHINRILEHFGEKRLLATIDYASLLEFRRVLEMPNKGGNPPAPASVNRVMACFRHMLTWAVKCKMMRVNPFTGNAKELFFKENNTIDRYLSQDEIAKLLDASPEYLREIIVCGINTGMRRGEILSLKWQQIKDGRIYLTHTKSDKARQVPVTQPLAELFKTIRRREGLRSELVFAGVNGKKYRGNKIENDLKASCDRAGIPYGRKVENGITFHCFRHTYASFLMMRTGNLNIIRELLGHSSLTTTQRYMHVSDQAKVDAVAMLNDLTPMVAVSQIVPNQGQKPLEALKIGT